MAELRAFEVDREIEKLKSTNSQVLIKSKQNVTVGKAIRTHVHKLTY